MLIFSIIWNHSGFYVVDTLPNDTKMNNAYFVTNVLIPLEEAIFFHGRVRYERGHVIHLDNCPIHTSRASTDWLEEHDIVCMQQLSYSPDLAPRDFCLFATVKENSNGFGWLTGISFWSLSKRFLVVSMTKN
jgi:hypothetical protein